ncbi:FAR1-RELATED SEQUENCE 7-like isoform X1 [Olea europaea subsp. europaea]|uniref:FAR1-RELATED SEQUENCE 7-like isoform X1 n=2 Tax=Olea europaea subsp. europaea TaxID=158383 RepID=A0A8S0QJM2_OLEEU|nr:FAR1-RELATED SEQUENCE 7-like isoform X1 [Olea europaea subsp. europaea]
MYRTEALLAKGNSLRLVVEVEVDQGDTIADSNAEGNDGELEGSEEFEGEENYGKLEEDDDVEAEDNTSQVEGGEVLEPYVGMEFESEGAARSFYNDYARRIGFVVRIMQRRRSEIDGRTLARRLGCNKQGFSASNKGKIGQDKKQRPSAREGCKATILFKVEKSGKWVVTRFVKDHNHPLVVTAHEYSKTHDKDEKIQQLTRELHRQDQLCAAYRERLLNFLASVEEQAQQLSLKVQEVVNNVKRAEAEEAQVSSCR